MPASGYELLKAALRSNEYVIKEVSFTGEIVEAMRQVSRAEVPDMPDRIAATAIHAGVPVITPEWAN